MQARPDFMHDFPGWLDAALDAAHWRKSDLAAETGITKGHISNIANGKVDPKLRTVAKIVDALKAHERKLNHKGGAE